MTVGRRDDDEVLRPGDGGTHHGPAVDGAHGDDGREEKATRDRVGAQQANGGRARDEYVSGDRAGDENANGDHAGGTDGGRLREDDVAGLVAGALKGSADAWDGLVERFSNRVWAICRVYRLGPADAADVFQQTWLRALENLSTLRDHAAFGAWLGTTCRNEARAALRRAKRTHPVDETWLLDLEAGPDGDPELPMLVEARDAELWAAFNRLMPRCQRVLRVLVVDAEDRRPSYELAASSLDIPIGSLGPTRKRCLAQLRKFLTERIEDEGLHS
ncbi:RNA polymerase sigma factor [Symbioplanes lichenis]|uniref:RNA polymerase sigma factor n=1 Tax=Symbioplanes lichenis TaxID=1629072 RepID=UPI002739A8AB|nr:sigma-70 family RNA polymerase sigma factor [Actinoplanes lichenis]